MSDDSKREPDEGAALTDLAPVAGRIRAEHSIATARTDRPEGDAWSTPLTGEAGGPESSSRLAAWTPSMDQVREIPEPDEQDTQVRGPFIPPRLIASAAVPRVLVSQRRQPCEHCGGVGFMPNVSDYLRESIALLGNQGDEVVRTFYATLFRGAPDLVRLFPGDPTQGDLGTDHKGARQRELLLSALAALAELYDPEDADRMARLDTALASFGRKHAAFSRPDGTIRGATWEEYGAVKDALFQTLIRAAGEHWKTEYGEAWSQAYDYAAAVMVAEQHRSGFSAPRFPRA